MTQSPFEIWAIIAALGVGTFLVRFSFIGLIGGQNFPEWALRPLRYATVAVLPGLVAPLILWPAATGGEPDPARLMATAATLTVGLWTRSALYAIGAGMAALYLGLWAFG